MIKITESDSKRTVAYSQSERGAPALLIGGDRNEVVAGYLQLTATGSGPAVMLTGADNYLRFELTIVKSSGLIAVQGSDHRDVIFNAARSITGAIDLGGGDDYFQSNNDTRSPTVFGGEGNDVFNNYLGTASLDFRGDAGEDWLNGGSEADRLDGGTGDDELFGNGGADRLDGGAGDDRLEGGAGYDTLNGGGGNDLAVFAGLRTDYDYRISNGSGTVTDRRTGDASTGADTLTDIPILRFQDEQLDTRIVRNELRLTAEGERYTNAQNRYGLSALDLAGKGSTLVNTATIEGTGLRFLRLDAAGQLVGETAALAIEQDNVTVENRAGANIVAIGDALGTVGALERLDASSFRYLGTGLTVRNAGTIRSTEYNAINLTGTDLKLVNEASGVITAGGVAVSVPNGPATIVNAGLIAGTFPGLHGGINAGQLDLDNSGTIRGGIHTGSTYATIRNTGTIEGGYDAYNGLRLQNARSSSGDLVVDLGAVSYSTEDYTHSVIENSGLFAGKIVIGGNVEFRNAPTDNVYLATITNSGTLTGDISSTPKVAPLPDGSRPHASFVETLINSGRIEGVVDLGDGADVVNNTGIITGAVRLGDGDDTLATHWNGIGGAIHGGLGFDTIDWSGSTVGGRFDLGGGTVRVNNTEQGMTGFEAILGTGFADTMLGSGAADHLSGSAGDDLIRPGRGFDTVDGGDGFDTLELVGNASDYRLLQTDGRSFLLGAGGAVDVAGIEQVRFADGSGKSWQGVVTGTAAFDALGYIASYRDLVGAFGVDAARGAAHFAASGFAEGRGVTFDALAYAASYADLRQVFGTDTGAATRHYITMGSAEGRTVSFDALSYVAGYSDLIGAFGTNTDAAARHYITTGVAEGRGMIFDTYGYLASNPAVLQAVGADTTAAAMHYITTGAAQGLSTSGFSALRYTASYADLIGAFGTDATAATRHYVLAGAAEGRSVTFDSWSYLASYADLIRAFGADAEAATRHYVQWGVGEHRGVSFDPLAYAAANPDVRASYGTDRDALARHYVLWGYAEGRQTSTPAAMSMTPDDDHSMLALHLYMVGNDSWLT